MSLNIRLANVSDTNLIASLGATTFYEAYFRQDQPKHLGDYIAEAFSPKQIKCELEHPHSIFFVAELDGKAIGYAKLRQEKVESSIKYEPSIELQRIYLLEAFWGKNLGSLILHRCCLTAAENAYKSIWLGVWEHNPRAQKFYEKHGFMHVGDQKFLYGGHEETNFVYEKPL